MIHIYNLVSPYVEEPEHGILFYNDEDKTFGYFMPEGVDFGHQPSVFSILSEKKRLINDREVRMWVKDRIVPPERQNIGEILRNVGIETYDEFEILKFCKGRSCMDAFEMEDTDMTYEELQNLISEYEDKDKAERV